MRRTRARDVSLDRARLQTRHVIRVRRPRVKQAAVPAVQPAATQTLRPVSAQVPLHPGLFAGPVLSRGKRPQHLPAGQAIRGRATAAIGPSLTEFTKATI